MKRLALMALLGVAACSSRPPAPPPPITRVELRLMPGTGRAWVSFDSSGAARGGSVSGESPPRMHVDTDTIPADSVRALFGAARALGDTLLARRGPPADSARTGTATLVVGFSDGTQAQFVWMAASQPIDPRVQAVLQHVVANRIGGW